MTQYFCGHVYFKIWGACGKLFAGGLLLQKCSSTVLHILNVGKGAPLRLVLGKSKMIAGWEEGIPTMSKGEVAMVSHNHA